MTLIVVGGEQPLKKDTSCNLGSINLSEFVLRPYTSHATIDYEGLAKSIDIGVKALDELIDENKDNHPLEVHKANSLSYRNIGLGIMGYGTALFKLGIKYGSKECIEFTDNLFKYIFRNAVISSSNLATEKGKFPKYKDIVFDSEIIRNHFSNEEIEKLKKQGLRNCSLISIAPNGSISTMLDVTGGCEPEFALKFRRKTESLDGEKEKYYYIYCSAIQEYQEITGKSDIPDYFVSSADINWKNRIDVQATMQNHVDTAISSTVNLPKEIGLDEIDQLYLYAWEKKLKGITVFRDGCKKTGILTTDMTDKKEKVQEDTLLDLPRGMIYEVSDDLIGKKRKLRNGCGSLYVNCYFDRITGNMMEVFLSKGSSGGCHGYSNGLSRVISIALRGGIPIEAIVDQLSSVAVCPSYIVRTATKHDTSKGSNCPDSIGHAMMEMQKEMWDEVLDDDDMIDEITTKKAIKIQKEKQNINKVTSQEEHKQLSKGEQDNNESNKCPVCGEELFYTMGCRSCSCGFSYCG